MGRHKNEKQEFYGVKSEKAFIKLFEREAKDNI